MKNTRILIALFFALVSLGTMAQAQAPFFDSHLIYENDPTHPFCHAASIVELNNGDLFAAWYAGSEEGAKDVVIKSARLPKGQKQWTKPIIAEDSPNFSEGNPVLWVDQKGIVWMFFVTMHGNWWTECKVKYKQSTDQGKTWGATTVLHDELGWMTGNKPITLSNGEILLPLYDEKNWSTIVMISSDQGKSWKQTAEVKSNPGNIQSSVVELANGDLMMLMRSGGPIAKLHVWQSFSKDRGRTWSTPVSSGLKNPNARIDQVKLKTGHLVLAFNDTYTKRQQLNVALSTDEGRTWNPSKFLENQAGEYSYPAIIQTRDGRVHCVYTYRRTQIKHVIFNEAWLAQK